MLIPNSVLPPTVLASFDQILPRLTRSKNKYETHKSETGSTVATIAPEFLYWQPSQEFEKRANQVTNSDEIKHSILNELRLATDFPGCRLETEGDVVFNSALYNVLPCLEVLERQYPGKWYIYSERSEGLQMSLHNFNLDLLKAKRKMKPPTAKSSLRYDLIFKPLSDNSKDEKTVAVIEYKKAGTIRYADCKYAMLDIGATPAEVKERQNKSRQGEYEVSLASNGLVFTQQARKYASQSRCSHVAVFN